MAGSKKTRRRWILANLKAKSPMKEKVDREFEDYVALRSRLDQWNEVAAPTASDVKLKEEMIPRLTAELEALDLKHRRARGDFLDGNSEPISVNLFSDGNIRGQLANLVLTVDNETQHTIQWPEIFAHPKIRPLCEKARLYTTDALRKAVKAAGVSVPARRLGRGQSKRVGRKKIGK